MKLLLTLAITAASTTMALAGGPITVADDPVPYVAPATAAPTDWTGFYAGLGYGRSSGDIDFIPAPARELDDGTATSVFLGYLWQRNTLVYGAELAYTKLNDATVTGFASEVDSSVDLKGRVGFAANRALFYGVLGYSMASYDEGLGDWDPSGMSYGVGVDYLATNRLVVGLEYLARDLNGDDPLGSAQEVDIDLDTISLRVGFKF